MKLKNIHEEMTIKVSPERMWQVLTRYGDVSIFHAGVVESHKVPGSSNEASPGCERVCNIVDMGLKIVLKERIIDYREGEGYQYEIYEWKNFPLQKMLFGFTIKPGTASSSILRIDIDYRAKPGWLTSLMAWKMRQLIHDVLLGYKHYSETGEKRVSVKRLRKKYAGMDITTMLEQT